jgi:hypothetical protein
MKINVNRQLSGGIYHVNFSFTDFTSEELAKMAAFGVPGIKIQYGPPPRATLVIAVNQINKNLDAGFVSEEEAKSYEQSVITQARTAMEALRQRKDEFTSSEEVTI